MVPEKLLVSHPRYHCVASGFVFFAFGDFASGGWLITLIFGLFHIAYLFGSPLLHEPRFLDFTAQLLVGHVHCRLTLNRGLVDLASVFVLLDCLLHLVYRALIHICLDHALGRPFEAILVLLQLPLLEIVHVILTLFVLT